MQKFVSKEYKKARKVKTGNMTTEDYLRMRKMCTKCRFFIDGQCLKQRIIKKCAELGLKDKE